MAFILEVIIFLALLGFAIHALKWGIGIAGKAVLLVLAIVAGIPVGIGYGTEALLGKLRLRAVGAVAVLIVNAALFVGVCLGQNIYIAPFGLESFAYLAPVLGGIALLHQSWLRRKAEALSDPIALFGDQDKETYRGIFAAFFVGMAAALTETIFIWEGVALSWIYWAIALVLQAGALYQEIILRERLEEAHKALVPAKKLNASQWLSDFKIRCELGADKAEAIYFGILLRLIREEKVDEIELNGTSWIVNHSWHEIKRRGIGRQLEGAPRVPVDVFWGWVTGGLEISMKDAVDYSARHLEFGAKYAFEDGDAFVHYVHVDRIRVCSSCGVAEEGNNNDAGEWHCTAACIETESICEAEYKKPFDLFLSEAATSGFIVMAGANSWTINHKAVAAGGQGHGFAAELANDRIDKLMGRSAKIVGGNNAKDGADRLVDGQFLQTKYCKTPGKSVGSCFNHDPSTGRETYRYMDGGKPMAVEVPRDQYEGAVKDFERRIKAGQVPGVTDPEEAKQLVVKGHLTYEQAQSIVKFGTFESLSYDALEGVVVGAGAASIGFVLTTFVFYLNTGDAKKAMQVAVVQAGKAFGKTFVIHVGTRQLHRLESVQSILKNIDADKLPTGLAEFLQKGMGLESRNQLTRALQGTLVTSVVVIAVTTGPDLIKLIRGRMSQAQFVKNVAVAASGVAGGALGATVGGAIGATLGPVGLVAGNILGGMAGGVVSAAFASEVASGYMEDDQVRMLRIVNVQVEYLATLFLLTADEVNNLASNLDRILTPKTFEVLHAKGNKRAYANQLIKPVVIRIVKQRPALDFTERQVIEAIEEMA